MILAEVRGTGSCLPGPALTNEVVAGLFGRGVKHLCEAIGIRQRHWAVEPEAGWRRSGLRNSEMSACAARAALEDAGVAPEDVDLLLLVTATPDYPFPATATLVQERLDVGQCTAIELRGACAGVTQALTIADLFIRSGRASVALVIGSELSSALINFSGVRDAPPGQVWPDDLLLSAAMFGDGAGALVLAPRSAADEREGLFATFSSSVGSGQPPGFLCRFGGSASPFVTATEASQGTYLLHDFRAILELGPRLVVRALDELMSSAGLGFEDFRLIIPPQANPALTLRTLSAEGRDGTRVFSNVARIGNTSSASLLIALDEANRTGRLAPGDRVALLGAEASKWLYGAAAFTWTRNGAAGAARRGAV